MRAFINLSLLCSLAHAGAGSDEFGQFTADIPITVPAFHKLEPTLKLAYSSLQGNGLVGVGWSLAASSMIQRSSPGGGAPAWDAGDVFYLDGQPLVACAPGSASPSCVAGGTHSTRIESYS